MLVEKVEPEVLSGGTSSRHKLQLEKFNLYLTSNFSVLRVAICPRGQRAPSHIKQLLEMEQPDPALKRTFAPLPDDVNLLTKADMELV